MKTAVGSDPDRLEQAAGQFIAVASRFEGIRNRLGGMLSQAAESGSTAQAYHRMRTNVLPLVTEGLQASHKAASELQKQALRQRQRSGGRPPQGTSPGQGAGPHRVDRSQQKYKDTYLSVRPPNGQRVMTTTGAVDPTDPRIYVIRLFIPEDKVSLLGFGGYGDGRGYSTDPDGTVVTDPNGTAKKVTSKVAIVLDPEYGTVSYTTYDSRQLDGTVVPALKIGDGFKVLDSRPGFLEFTFAAQNSIYPSSASIDGRYSLSIDHDSRGNAVIRLSGSGDGYPSLEAFYVDPNGKIGVIGTAERGSPLDLLWPNDDRSINLLHQIKRTQ